jgi:type I restriction enzyme M protein
VQDILDSFDYRAVVGKMVKNARLAPILNQYSKLDIGPDQLSSLEMGYIYEELLRRFSEAHAEAAGDHFTPREIIRLMVELLEIPIPTRHTSIYDPACGTGGMLYVAKEHLLDKATTEEERQRVEQNITLHGTELLSETYAIAQSEALIRGEKPTQTVIRWGNSLIPHDPQSKDPGDQFPESRPGQPLRLHAQQSALWRHLGRQGRLSGSGEKLRANPLQCRYAVLRRWLRCSSSRPSLPR